MTFQLIAQLLAQFGPIGIDIAETLWKRITQGTPITQADFDGLRAKLAQTARDRLTAQLVAAGIPLDDPIAVKLLSMT